ncbi:DUF885 family protein [Thalassiella azotivora]
MQADVREGSGLHEYDGRVQDLSVAGVRDALAALGGEPLADPHDEAHLAAFEAGLRWSLGEHERHRRDPLLHAMNLDLACYDREYAPVEERERARRQHLAAWPEAVDAAVGALDQVPAPVAAALVGAVEGLAAGVRPDDGDVGERALAAHGRFVDHVRRCAATGDPDTAVGSRALARELGTWEALEVDVEALAVAADVERDRLTALLGEACGRLDATRPTAEVVADLLRDHPDADGVLTEARAVTEEVLAFTRDHDLAPWTDGECLVGPAPPSRSWAMAMMAWAAPEEPDAPSWYHVTPPDPSWPADEVEQWLAVFSRTSLPAITVHEVAPGHYAHGRALRHAATPVRRVLQSSTFAEGWAHYVEEAVVDEGFRAQDPRYVAGMCLEALVRVTRLACSVGLHAGGMTVDEATRRFGDDAFLGLSAARSEAQRGTFDVGYGRYTWGKLALLDLREQARERWGADFSVPRFHRALLDLGSPPLGLVGTALERG